MTSKALSLALADSAQALPSLDDARDMACDFVAKLPPLGEMPMALDSASERILAQPVVAGSDLPPFDCATMDGYAVARSDLVGEGPWRLQVAGSQNAGDAPVCNVLAGRGRAVAIAAGASVPSFADAVVPSEDVQRTFASVTLYRRPAVSSHIRTAGSVVPEGTTVLAPPAILQSRDMGLIAALGKDRVTVRRKLKIGLLSTGSELAEPGSKPGKAQMFDANRTMLAAMLRKPWIGLTDLGIVRDNLNVLTMTLRAAAESHRIIVTTGGSGDGATDHLAEAIERLDGSVMVRGIEMKPGRTTLVGTIGETLILGLSGNPVAAWIGMTVLGMDITRAAAGLPARALTLRRGRSSFTYRARPGRVEMPLVNVHQIGEDGCANLFLARETTAPTLSRLSVSDGIALIPPQAGTVQSGAEVDWLSFDGAL